MLALPSCMFKTSTALSKAQWRAKADISATPSAMWQCLILPGRLKLTLINRKGAQKNASARDVRAQRIKANYQN